MSIPAGEFLWKNFTAGIAVSTHFRRHRYNGQGTLKGIDA
jgi:hypothetical protein